MNLMEDETKPTSSVFNIFKQVRWELQDIRQKLRFCYGQNFWVFFQIINIVHWVAEASITLTSYYWSCAASNLITSQTLSVPVWQTGYIILIKLFMFSLIRFGWWLCLCASSSLSPLEFFQPWPSMSSRQLLVKVPGVSLQVPFMQTVTVTVINEPGILKIWYWSWMTAKNF